MQEQNQKIQNILYVPKKRHNESRSHYTDRLLSNLALQDNYEQSENNAENNVKHINHSNQIESKTSTPSMLFMQPVQSGAQYAQQYAAQQYAQHIYPQSQSMQSVPLVQSAQLPLPREQDSRSQYSRSYSHSRSPSQFQVQVGPNKSHKSIASQVPPKVLPFQFNDVKLDLFKFPLAKPTFFILNKAHFALSRPSEFVCEIVYDIKQPEPVIKFFDGFHFHFNLRSATFSNGRPVEPGQSGHAGHAGKSGKFEHDIISSEILMQRFA